ncbi:helix-turn-helix transcriptional regulator [uncultured Ferrovibrio sp.]|jgi:XRE family aerobic/anaerobic benzoate catabolism transcriptional regulator|uniref:helix-turn-helix transcriptional regulator n=1 Tax=uncultured Ferrovibrio sp. TaxID=1576913 RepID=UPI00262C0FC6|nr:helix-turn-helix transcriptional regulator [uncultured Ferrovibrio sp.]
MSDSRDKQNADDAAFLQAVGERVRNARARRGMSRKILAKDSGVSERYIAQLESGAGNISILLLRQIARAMDLSITEFLGDRAPLTVDQALLLRQVEDLTPQQLQELQTFIRDRFGIASSVKRHIALIGLRGAGKTTLGQKLAGSFGLQFIEMAKEIEAEAGISLNEIFDLYGQAAYRRFERRALERVTADPAPKVIATGGSLPSEPSTYAHLLSHCFTIWLKAQPEEHMGRVVAQGDLRPIAGHSEAMADLKRILAQREALYARADMIFDTAGKTVEQASTELIAALRNHPSWLAQDAAE